MRSEGLLEARLWSTDESTGTKPETKGARQPPSEPIDGGEFSEGARQPPCAGSKPGPKPMTEAHEALAEIVEPRGVEWKDDKILKKICAAADRKKIPTPKRNGCP